ncbi:hypothetical protein BO94DRAFT_586826 [Aspergillus sclerotioniger CBS 115572]|uniref:Uncharacterized protein n=1 Tax=Aspergillus sclerotioniger CBS 115572 TaxID=1450535 RepID=A0A317WBA4_9EURO|nr:hypothetical protein BO94DRAFT_586826 [Aspergillus sclerotioniger CBS 115572]PWY83776.1 hypothetical protein BO94DRAFT_586826 [Aspergillus sclerotioniger CBS 115572]
MPLHHPSLNAHHFSWRSIFNSKKDRRFSSASTTLYEKVPNTYPPSEQRSTPQASIPEPSPSPTPSPTQTTFIWQDINPPTEADDLLSDNDDDDTLPSYITTTSTTTSTTPTEKDKDLSPELKTMIDTTKQALHSQLTNPSTPPTSLPGYNDVSGAVVVDWDGLPHFLSPQEEEDRKMKLQRAVQERMLGLPRRTEFQWQGDGRSASLPKYPSTDAGAIAEAKARRSSVR